MKPIIKIYRLSEYVFDFKDIPDQGMFKTEEMEFYGKKPKLMARYHAQRLNPNYKYVFDESHYHLEMATR